jgi:hypothetical protein
MSFHKVFNEVNYKVFDTLYRLGSLRVGLDNPTTLRVERSLKGLSPTWQLLLAKAGPTDLIDFYVTSQIVGEGPKVFQLDREYFEELEGIDLNISLEDYKQPLPTVIFELPKGYYKQKRVICPQSGEIRYGLCYPEMHEPLLVIVHKREDVNLIHVLICFDSMQSIKLCLYGADTVDDCLLKSFRADHLNEDSLAISHAERDAAIDLTRAALNACLLMDEVGIQKIGPMNPSYYARLARWKRGDVEDQLRWHPMIYDLRSRPKLSVHTLTRGGNVIKAHRRRGFYKMQHHGPGNTLRKRIRIKSVLVNWR